MTRSIRRTALVFAAAGLVGASAPVPLAHAGPDFGFSSTASAVPMQIELYEPTIPIPAEPQAEMELAYTKTEAATGPTGHAVASWIWPGDSVGQGFKTFGEALQLPEQLYENGYPVQVNAKHPQGPEHQADEPFPGSVMRAGADAEQAVAKVGWSTDSRVTDDEDSSKPAGDGDGGPGLPLPEGGGDPLQQLTDALSGQRTSAAADDDEPPPSPGLPPELAALVDVDGMASISRSVIRDDVVRSISSSTLDSVTLLGGIITADAVKVTSSTSSNGKKSSADGRAQIVGLEFNGEPITVTREGVEGGGNAVPLGDLPKEPAAALEDLGISFVLPKGVRSSDKLAAESSMEGLQIVIETRPLREQLKDVPLADLVGQLPDETGELKSLLGALAVATPKIVITLGTATTETETVKQLKIDLPTVDPETLPEAGGPSTGGDSVIGGVGASASGPGGLDAGIGSAPGLDAGAAGTGDSVATAPMSAGLPPLASVPGALMVGGLLLASGLGWWLQRVGGSVLGGAGSCAHGLETGVPDLRKA